MSDTEIQRKRIGPRLFNPVALVAVSCAFLIGGLAYDYFRGLHHVDGKSWMAIASAQSGSVATIEYLGADGLRAFVYDHRFEIFNRVCWTSLAELPPELGAKIRAQSKADLQEANLGHRLGRRDFEL